MPPGRPLSSRQNTWTLLAVDKSRRHERSATAQHAPKASASPSRTGSYSGCPGVAVVRGRVEVVHTFKAGRVGGRIAAAPVFKAGRAGERDWAAPFLDVGHSGAPVADVRCHEGDHGEGRQWAGREEGGTT